MERIFDKPSRSIAIVGGGPSRSEAPFSDPSWEIWMFGRGKLPIPRVDRWFEMHSVEQMKRFRGDRKRKMWYPEYWQFLGRLKCPVYMIRQHAQIPRSVPYPLHEVKTLRTARQQDGLHLAGHKYLLLALGKAGQRYNARQIELLQHFHRRRQLTLAAVYDK